MSVTATAAGGLGIRVIMNKKIYLVKGMCSFGVDSYLPFCKKVYFLIIKRYTIL